MTYRACPGVILSSSCGRYYLANGKKLLDVNETVAFYWNFLREGADAARLASAARQEYDIEVDSLESEIADMLAQLAACGMVTTLGKENA